MFFNVTALKDIQSPQNIVYEPLATFKVVLLG